MRVYAVRDSQAAGLTKCARQSPLDAVNHAAELRRRRDGGRVELLIKWRRLSIAQLTLLFDICPLVSGRP